MSINGLRFALVVLAVVYANIASGATLDEVKARGRLICGVNQGLLGFAKLIDQRWVGFDIDFCRAVAAAIFHDDQKVDYVPLSAAERFEALRNGKVDVLSRNSTWTLGREVKFGLTFAGITYFDGQGFMLPRSAGIFSSLELDGKIVCVLEGTTSETNLSDYFATNNMSFETIAVAASSDSLAAYRDRRCNVMTSDISQLYALRLELPDPDEHLILADTISKEPLGPVVRQSDPAWAMLIKWVLFALLNAEVMGISSDTIDGALESDKPDVRRFVGKDGNFGTDMELTNDWAVHMIRLVGNYGEIFDRNLGVESRLGISRGMNQLWNLGGIHYPPPIR